MKGFLGELRRRKVFTVAAAYAVVAWLLLQVAATLFPIFDAPDWMLQVFTVLLFLGFPLALVLAWAYDITPQGIARDKADRPDIQTPDQTDSREGKDQALTLPAGPSIAVLPFANLSGDPDQDLFAEALTGDIISGLTRASHLFVLASGATAGLGAGETDLQELGTKLGVSYLLQGSVRKSGEMLRVSAQLANAGTGVQMWSQNYDRQLSAESLFDVQDDIREQIVSTLSDFHGVIYSSQTKKNVHRPTDSLDAYECLSVALAYDKFLTPEYHLRARESLERAVAIDPEFDQAWSHLSWIYTDEWAFGYNPLPDPMERALTAARKGVELAPNNHHNHWLLSRVHYFSGDRELFLAEAEKALELNASDGTTIGLIGLYMAWCGEWDRGMALMDKARLLNPNFPDYYHFAAATAEFARGEYAGALTQMQRMTQTEWVPARIFLAANHALLGRAGDAAASLKRLDELHPGFNGSVARSYLGRTFPFQPDLVASVMRGLRAAGLDGGRETDAE